MEAAAAAVAIATATATPLPPPPRTSTTYAALLLPRKLESPSARCDLPSSPLMSLICLPQSLSRAVPSTSYARAGAAAGRAAGHRSASTIQLETQRAQGGGGGGALGPWLLLRPRRQEGARFPLVAFGSLLMGFGLLLNASDSYQPKSCPLPTPPPNPPPPPPPPNSPPTPPLPPPPPISASHPPSGLLHARQEVARCTRPPPRRPPSEHRRDRSPLRDMSSQLHLPSISSHPPLNLALPPLVLHPISSPAPRGLLSISP